MADLTKCPDKDCPKKEKCYRFTATADSTYQSFYVESPRKVKGKKSRCNEFWDNKDK